MKFYNSPDELVGEVHPVEYAIFCAGCPDKLNHGNRTELVINAQKAGWHVVEYDNKQRYVYCPLCMAHGVYK